MNIDLTKKYYKKDDVIYCVKNGHDISGAEYNITKIKTHVWIENKGALEEWILFDDLIPVDEIAQLIDSEMTKIVDNAIKLKGNK